MDLHTRTLQDRRYQALFEDLGRSLYNQETGELLPANVLIRYVLPEDMSQSRAYAFRKWVLEHYPRCDGSLSQDVEERPEFVVIASDFHGRSVDPALYSAFRSFLRSHKVDRLILNGDIMDGESVSKYAKSNTLSWGDEIKVVKQMLAELVSDVPGARVDWIDGNHEERFYKYMALNAPQVAGVEGMATLETLLDMATHSITYHTSREYVKLHHGLYVQHRYLVNPTAGTSASNSIKKLGGSIAIGDTHRVGHSWKFDRNGLHVAIEIGCMCLLDAEYMYKSGANWQNGFLVIRYHGPDKMPEYIQVVAHDGRFAFDGKVYG